MCLYPLKAFRVFDLDTGLASIHFKYLSGAEEVSLPCGKCVECLQSYSNEWAVRCSLEATLHRDNCMITLTYAHNPISVCRRDLQLFIKRLRKFVLPARIRYFGCGEYGKKGSRPHYHIIIFGWKPSDLVPFFKRDNHWVYKSADVARIWSYGFVSVEDVTFASARYTAKYLQKLQILPDGVLPPFTCMSLKPGIGLDAFKQSWLDTDTVYLGGKSYSIPRYFIRKSCGDFTLQVERRKLRGKLLSSTLVSRRKLVKERFGYTRIQKP